MSGHGEWGQCECQRQPLTTSPTKDKDSSDHDENGLKCFASNGKPCHFPFRFNEKVIELCKRYLILFNLF